MSFTQLGQDLSSTSYIKVRDGLRSNGWSHAAGELEIDEPLLAFSLANEKAVIVPPKHTSTLKKGDVLLGTCWAMGLSPRPLDLDEDGNKTILRFVESPLNKFSTQPPSIAVLQRAAKLVDDPLSLSGFPELELQVDDVAERLRTALGVGLQVHPHLARQWAIITLPPLVCFTQIMDALAMSLDAIWDWNGETAIMAPRCALYAPSTCADNVVEPVLADER